MARGKRNAFGASGSRSYKRARFKTIDTASPGENSNALNAAGTRASEAPNPPLPAVNVDTLNVYASADGRRLGQKSSNRSVTVNPAEWIFARNQPDIGSQGTDAEVADSVLNGLPVENAEGLAAQDNIGAPETTFTKKRVRHDLRAAVINILLWKSLRHSKH